LSTEAREASKLSMNLESSIGAKNSKTLSRHVFQALVAAKSGFNRKIVWL